VAVGTVDVAATAWERLRRAAGGPAALRIFSFVLLLCVWSLATLADPSGQVLPAPWVVCCELCANVTVGVSLSAMVSVCVPCAPTVWVVPPARVSTTVSSPSRAVSSTIATGTVAVVAAAGTVRVPESAV